MYYRCIRGEAAIGDGEMKDGEMEQWVVPNPKHGSSCAYVRVGVCGRTKAAKLTGTDRQARYCIHACQPKSYFWSQLHHPSI